MRRGGFIILSMAILALFSACEPKPDEAELLDQFVVQTNHDKSAKFYTFSTFTIQLDTIALYSNVPNSDPYLTAKSTGGFTTGVTAEIKKKMGERLFTYVEKKANPDLAINVFVIYNYSQYQNVVYTGGYGSGYYGYGGYGYGGYSPYYVQTTETNRGTLNIEIVDLKNKINNEVKVIWSSSMGDLFNAIDQYQQSIDAIDQSFEQSPYVQTVAK